MSFALQSRFLYTGPEWGNKGHPFAGTCPCHSALLDWRRITSLSVSLSSVRRRQIYRYPSSELGSMLDFTRPGDVFCWVLVSRLLLHDPDLLFTKDAC